MADLFAGCSFLQASSTTTNETLGTMSVPLDDIEKKCNELMEQGVSASWLEVSLWDDLSIRVDVGTEGRPFRRITFSIATPSTVPEVHSRVFATLARIVGRNEASNLMGVHVELPKGVDTRNDTRAAEMAPFLQNIANSSTIQWLRISVSLYGNAAARPVATHDNNTTESTDMVRAVAILAANMVLPQSALQKVWLGRIDFDNDLLATLCGVLSSKQCRLVEMRLDICRFPTLGPLWLAVAVNRSISKFILFCPQLDTEAPNGILGCQQVQYMLETNTTMTEFIIEDAGSRLSTRFFTALGAGLASNTTLKYFCPSDLQPIEHGCLIALFEGGLDRNIGLLELCLMLKDLSVVQGLVSGLDRMAKNISAKRRADGSHQVSTLKRLSLHFGFRANNTECFKLVLDCLVRHSACFALEEVHFKEPLRPLYTIDADHFVKVAAFIQAFSTVVSLRLWRRGKDTDDAHMSALASILENNTTMTEFVVGYVKVSNKSTYVNRWSPLDNPNHTRVLCCVVRNIRKLSMFLPSSKRRLLPSALATLLKPRKYEAEQVTNLNHALYLVRNLPELFSTDGRSGGGSEKVDSVAN